MGPDRAAPDRIEQSRLAEPDRVARSRTGPGRAASDRVEQNSVRQGWKGRTRQYKAGWNRAAPDRAEQG